MVSSRAGIAAGAAVGAGAGLEFVMMIGARGVVGVGAGCAGGGGVGVGTAATTVTGAGGGGVTTVSSACDGRLRQPTTASKLVETVKRRTPRRIGFITSFGTQLPDSNQLIRDGDDMHGESTRRGHRLFKAKVGVRV